MMKRLHSLSALITSDEHLSQLFEKAARLLAMQRALDQMTPAEMAGLCTIANIRGQTVIVHAANNAVAARLRLMLPRLLPTLRNTSKDVNGVRVEVQIPRSATGGSRQTRKTVLGASAGELLRTLERQLPASRLRNAVESLAKKSQP